MSTPASDLDTPRRLRLGRIAVIVIVAAIAAMWLYVWLPFPKPRPADLLDDPRFAATAEPICAATIERLQRLPLVTQDSPPQELAVVVADANEELREMVGDLAAIDRPDGRDGDLLERFLADWDTHVDDREAWVERLRDGASVPFTETVVRNGDGVSGFLTEFAEVNDMPSCGAPEYGGG
jgi:hypothetical protein